MDPRQTSGSSVGVTLWIHQQTRRVESEARSNLSRVSGATSLRDLVHFGEVRIPAELRYARNSIPGLRTLEFTIEKKIEVLLRERTFEITKAESLEAAKALRGKLMQECNVLRGKYSRQYRFADDESRRCLYLKQKIEQESASPI